MEEKTMEENQTQENQTQENQTEAKKRRSWLIPVVVAVIVAAVAIGAAVYFLTRPAISDPYAAAREAVDGLPVLPNPVTLGVLGQGEVDGVHFGVSGNLNLQVDEDGLALSLTDFTLGYEEGSTDLEVALNQEAAAIRLPGVLGEGWYGVDLTRDLRAQAVETAGEELTDWYFADGKLEEVQQTVDDLCAELAQVHDLGFADEIKEMKALLADAPATVEKVDDGFVLTFDKTAESDRVSPPVIFHLDAEKRMTSLEFGLAAGGHFLLDLGDPAEPSPRLELEWGEGNSLELAFTVAEGEAVAMPEFENAFSLLAILAAVEP